MFHFYQQRVAVRVCRLLSQHSIRLSGLLLKAAFASCCSFQVNKRAFSSSRYFLYLFYFINLMNRQQRLETFQWPTAVEKLCCDKI